jgi:hypothetical protein
LSRVLSPCRSSAHHDDRDVVPAAALEREIDERVGHARAIARHEGGRDLPVAHGVAQAVAAQHENVAVLRLHGGCVEVERVDRADRTGDGRSERPVPERCREAVVAREQPQAAAPAQIEPAVPGPQVAAIAAARRQDHHRAPDDRHDAGRGFGPQPPIRCVEPLARGGDELGETAGRPNVVKGRDHRAARKLADGVSAHAVGDRPEAALGTDEASVLVDVVNQPGVGAGGRSPAKPAARNGSSPERRAAPSHRSLDRV